MKPGRRRLPLPTSSSWDSHLPVSSGLLRSGTGIIKIKVIPRAVGTSILPCRSTMGALGYFGEPLLTSFSMVAARVAGVPIPMTPMPLRASLMASSSMSFPAVFIAKRRSASVRRLGGSVALATVLGSKTFTASLRVTTGKPEADSSSSSSALFFFLVFLD